MNFGLMADVQYAEKPTSGKRHYAAAKLRLEECVDAMNAQTPRPAFVIQMGDLIDGGEHAEEELKTASAIYNRLTMPRYHVLGNHDFAGLYRQETLKILGMERAYYTFDWGDLRFVVLDTQDVAIQGGWPENSPSFLNAIAMLERLRRVGAANAQEYNGGVGREQMDWLNAVLDEADSQKKRVIVFGHLPLLPAGETHTLWNAEDIVAMFERHSCVKAYFCGHIHRGNTLQQNGIHYVSFEAMVDWADQTAVWYEIRLAPDVIEARGAGIQQHWILSPAEMK